MICNTHYPSVLKDHPEVEFKLSCRKFMELVKRAQIDTTKSISNHHDDDEYEAQSLQVSKNNHDQSNKRTTAHADLDASNNSKNKKQKLNQTLVTLQDAIKFGNTLRTRYGPELEKNKSMNSELLTAFSTLAYTDLTDKAVAYLYEIPYIETVVSEVNSAILESIGKYPNSSIERIYRQVSVAIEELSLGGNAKAALLDPKRDCLKDTNI
ncbi:CTLH/CRA C-terminal to lish motif domain-containing protein [Pilaira anomala]|nr:CTLH/CRA C-terminal to lish motif domain-containing protein [Pilaira anomala]